MSFLSTLFTSKVFFEAFSTTWRAFLMILSILKKNRFFRFFSGILAYFSLKTDVHCANSLTNRQLKKKLKRYFIDTWVPPNNLFDHKKHSGEV